MSGFKILGNLFKSVEAAYTTKPDGIEFLSLVKYLKFVMEKFANSEIEYKKD